MHRKRRRRRRVNPGVIVLILILAATAVTSGSAWYTNRWQNGYNSFVADDPGLPPFKMWKTTYGAGDVWTEIQDQDGINYKITSADIEESGQRYTIDVSSMHFGVIDNIVNLNASNYVYMRFDIDTEIHGRDSLAVDFRLTDPAVTALTYPDGSARSYPFTVYETSYASGAEAFSVLKDSAEPSVTINAELGEFFSENPFFLVGYYLTADAPADGEAPSSFDDMLFTSFDETSASFGAPIVIDTTDIPETGEYYLYVRLNPNSECLSEMVKILGKSMPAVLLFDMALAIEVY